MPNIKHAFTSAIADGGNASLVQPSNWNAEHTLQTYLDFPVQASAPSAPGTAGSIMRTWAQELANHPFLFASGYGEPDGYPIQPLLWWSNNGMWSASSGTAISAFSLPWTLNSGSVSTPAASIGNFQSMTRRFVIDSASLAASQAGIRNGAAVCHTGGAVASTGSPGGYLFACTVGTPRIVASSTRGFVGLQNSTSAPTIGAAGEPAALTTAVGFGFPAGGSVWAFFSSSAASPAASVALTGFDVSASAWHRFIIHNPPGAGGSVIYWHAINMHSLATSSGSVTSPIPNSASLLNINCYIQATGAGSKALSFSSVFLETEY